MRNRIIGKIFSCGLAFLTVLVLYTMPVYGQVSGSMTQEFKFMRVGRLHQWFSSAGAEIEYGRRGRSGFESVDQLDGLEWPGDFQNQDINVGQSLWIGTTDFDDPVTRITYPYKVVSAGRNNIVLGEQIIPESIEMVGKYEHPSVYINNFPAAFLDTDPLYDAVDRIDENLTCDRMIINKFHTTIGISCTRKIMAFTHPDHDDYLVYEYVFKNTGIIDKTLEPKRFETLTGVVFHWQFRNGFAGESYLEGWSPTGANWGLNTLNDCIGQDANHIDPVTPNMRACWSYYGPISTSGDGYLEDIGLPDHVTGDILAGTNYAGVVTLHADISPQDNSNDQSQPSSTMFQPSDRGAQGTDQYDPNLMTRKYTEYMTAGHPAKTHAEQVGAQFANTWGGDAGGYAATQAYGPYTMAVGDSIRIVFAQAVSGIMSNRAHVREIAYNWFNETGNYVLPDGSTTTNRNEYKNTWVQSGKDSLFNTFRNAMANYESGYTLAYSPIAPSTVNVNSGGNSITVEWSNEAETDPNFAGYEVWKSMGRWDTTYARVFSCDANNAVNSFEDFSISSSIFAYYYVLSKATDPNSGNIITSSKFLTLASVQTPDAEAKRARPAGKEWSDLRIVPNPFHINVGYTQESDEVAPNQIAFYDLPGMCDIKIFTESGTLVESIQHRRNNGTVLYYSLTSARQVLSSGLYIVYFEVTEDLYDPETGELLFKKGDNTFKKLIVIR